jgi:hypothetical protein
LAIALIALLIVSALAMWCAQTWLSGKLAWLADHGAAELELPERLPGRAGARAQMGWVWTGQHRLLADRGATRAVLLVRGFALTFVASAATLVWLGRLPQY